ncbi:MAG TPA: RIO1 family regulatory kinase/ATPase [Candidatus Limnocylindrales bacterium]|nr:RIO1 family regulatory kinase/ATPase [Candidatus Limnocylindrales bacterium]
MSIDPADRMSAPPWLITHSFEEHPAGVLKSGKEAEIFLLERVSAQGSCLLAHKRYRPRYPKQGELRELGFSKGTIYRADKIYRTGWDLKRRERAAIDGRSRFGHELAATLWPANEIAMLRRAWQAGASVPYPVDRTDDGLLMEFVGDREQAAPWLGSARLDPAEVKSAYEQLVASLRAMSGAGIVHGDLSAYNILWWHGRLVIIDFPQAVEATTNPYAADLLHRDVVNACRWFESRRLAVDAEALFAELLGALY